MKHWYPSTPRWWYRWWMYPRWHRRRFIGVGSTWEHGAYYKIKDLILRVRGRCIECTGKGWHKMDCSRQGRPGKRNWSQDG